MMVRLGVVMTMRLERVFDVIPKGLREVVVLRHEVVLEMVDQEG